MIEYLRTFHKNGKNYELYKNHRRDVFLIGNPGCNGHGLIRCREEWENNKPVFVFTVRNGVHLVDRKVPRRVIESVGSL